MFPVAFFSHLPYNKENNKKLPSRTGQRGSWKWGITVGLAKRILSAALSALLTLGLCAPAVQAAGAGESFTLGIYFTGDLYGRWYSVDPNTGKTVRENYLKVVSAMEGQERKNNARLLIDLGNTFTGPASTYQMRMEQGETGPVALSLRYAGYDAFLPGSCERALTPESRQSLYNSLTDPAGTLSGTSVAVLQAEDGEEREERTAPFLVRSYPIDGREFRVGLVSLEKTWDWRELRQGQNCDLVVAAIPSGALEEGISDLVARTAGLDLILMNGDGVSGVISLRDSQGRRVPVVRGGGAALTRTEIVVNNSGSFTVGKSEGLDLPSRRNDDDLGALLAPYYEAAQTAAAQELGVLAGDWDWETDLSCVQSDTMDLIHEAQLWATQADVSIAAPLTGEEFCVRQLLEDQKTVPVDCRTCYTLYPREDDRLLVVRMTGTELKAWLEDSAGRYTVSKEGFVSGEMISQAGGVSYTLCLGNPLGERVMNLTFQGKPVAPRQIFRVAVSEGSLTDAGMEKDAYSVLWTAAESEKFRSVGGSVTWILGEYIRSCSAGYKQLTPPRSRSRWTVTAASGEEALSSVTRLEFVERFYDAVGRPSAYLDLKQTFADIDGENPAAAWAVQSGIVQGNGSGQFNPDDPINREQAAIMLLRFDLARDMGPSGPWAVAVPYTDATEISAWASEAVMWNVIREYLPDDEAGNFHPQSPLTALELEGILERLGG